MGIYAKSVEDKIKNSAEEYNILQNYDNYTYHIQFYMIPKTVQVEVDKLNDYKLKQDKIKNNKIVIAESGVTPNINIQNFIIRAVAPGGTLLTTATNFELSIDELGGELINKLAVTSKVIGYENHIIHPYYIDVWFEGYENISSTNTNKYNYSKGVPTKIGDRVYTYQCMIDKVKTQQQSDKMSYNFHLIWMPNRAEMKDYILTYGLGQIECGAGSTYKNFVDQLTTKLNAYYKLQDEKLYNRVYGETELFSVKLINYYNEIQSDTETTCKTLSSKTFKNNVVIKVDANKSLNSLLLEAWQQISGVCKYSVFLYPKMIYVKEENSISYYRIELNICFYVCPGLDKLQENVGGDGSYFLKAEEIQLEYLKDLLPLENSKIKKYSIHSVGTNTSVLSYKEDEDNLWYLNLGITSVKGVEESSFVEKYLETHKEERETFNQMVVKFNSGRHNIDDIYNQIPQKHKEMCLSIMNVGIIKESSVPDNIDGNSNVQNEKTDDIVEVTEEKNLMKAKLGYSSLFSVSNRKMIDMDIIGDPYWLGISDAYFDANLESISNLILPHIILSTKSFKRLDEKYDYKVNDEKVFNTPFRILQVTSTFSSGKFTQKLNGTIAIPFIQSSKNITYTDTTEKLKRSDPTISAKNLYLPSTSNKG